MLFKNDLEDQVITIILLLAVTLIFLQGAFYGHAIPMLISFIFFICTIVCIIRMLPGRVYVLLDEVGVTYSGLLGKTTIPWQNIAGSWTGRAMPGASTITLARVEEYNGSVHTLPVKGYKAEQIVLYINNYPLSFSND